MDSFQQYDTAARRIRDMPSPSPTQLKLQKAIYSNATQFLHLYMLPLKALPKVLKHATPHGSSSSQHGQGGRPGLEGSKSSLTLLNGPGGTHIRQNSSSAVSISSVNSARISELETEEKHLRERLIVLEEQKFLVSEMVADANRRRKFDEVAALQGNVEDLGREVDEVTRLLEGVRGEFAGAYLGSGMNTPVRRGSEAVIDKGKRTENG
jgi:rabenosyn-5